MNTVIAIHGVGNPAPGSIARTLAKTLGLGEASVRNTMVQGTEFVEVVEESHETRIVEVNWSDLLRPRSSLLGVLNHFWLLVNGMLLVIADQVPGTLRQRFLLTYGWALSVLTPGSILFPIAVLVTLSFEGVASRVTGLAGILTVAVVWALWTSKHTPWKRSPWLWVFLAALTIFPAFGLFWPTGPEWMTAGGLVYSSIQIFTYTLAMAGCMVAVLSGRKVTLKVRLARLALVYLPYLAITSFMIVPVCIALLITSGVGGNYESLMTSVSVPFDLPRVELVATVSVGLVGIAAVAGAVLYVLWKPRKAGSTQVALGNGRGSFARQYLAGLLVFCPLVLVASVFVYLSSVGNYFVTGEGFSGDVLDVYSLSLLRVFPFIPWFVGHLTIVTDILGDVIFYLLPDRDSPAGIAPECSRRLGLALEYAQKGGGKVVVVSHSQGSKVAADLRGEGVLSVPLITLGSPVASLYGDFLGKEVADGSPSVPWVNVFRDGDYIGGEIPGADNRSFGEGGHTKYWSDKKLKELVRLML